MTIKDILDAGILIEGYVRVNYWKQDKSCDMYAITVYEGEHLTLDLAREYKNKEIIGIYPIICGPLLEDAGVCIELREMSIY